MQRCKNIYLIKVSQYDISFDVPFGFKERQVQADQWKCYYCTSKCQIEALKLEHNGRHLVDDMFRYIFHSENRCLLNSLAPGRFEHIFRELIFQLIWVTDGLGISSKITLRLLPVDLTDDKSTLVQVMAWCRQATSHYLSQCWSRFMSLYGVPGPQWVKFYRCLFLRTKLIMRQHIGTCKRLGPSRWQFIYWLNDHLVLRRLFESLGHNEWWMVMQTESLYRVKVYYGWIPISFTINI